MAVASTFLCLPLYMVHQYEEHDGDRFRHHFNRTIGQGREVLSPLVVFLANVPGVWGVIGLSLRHYGVQDIDQRDDRNFVVAGPTSDSQTEVTLGYGRGLGSFLSLGGALRARHQSLAGYSASGFGVDLGITGQPWLAVHAWVGDPVGYPHGGRDLFVLRLTFTDGQPIAY